MSLFLPGICDSFLSVFRVGSFFTIATIVNQVCQFVGVFYSIYYYSSFAFFAHRIMILLSSCSDLMACLFTLEMFTFRGFNFSSVCLTFYCDTMSWIYAHTFIRTCVCVPIHVCVCVYIYIYIYTHAHPHTYTHIYVTRWVRFSLGIKFQILGKPIN